MKRRNNSQPDDTDVILEGMDDVSASITDLMLSSSSDRVPAAKINKSRW